MAVKCDVKQKGSPTMRKKYFCEEEVFGFIWDHADRHGIWDGDAATIAAEFSVTEDSAYAVHNDLCARNRIQRIGTDKYTITRWREIGEEEECY
jgi:hypothetical protein